MSFFERVCGRKTSLNVGKKLYSFYIDLTVLSGNEVFYDLIDNYQLNV